MSPLGFAILRLQHMRPGSIWPILVLAIAVLAGADAALPHNTPTTAHAVGVWTRTAESPPFGTSQGEAVGLQDGRILYVGGVDASGNLSGASQLYDPALDSWSLGPTMAEARANFFAGTLQSGKVLIVGSGSSELFDPATNTFAPAGALNVPHTRLGGAVLDDGRVLVAGGYIGCMTRAAEVFDPVTNSWSLTSQMLTARADFNLVKLTDGRVLAAGGDDDCAAPRKTTRAEVYDPATGSWTAVASLNVPRAHYTSALLSDGRVLLASGDNDLGRTATAEVYDPVANTWTLTAPMHRARFFSNGRGGFALPGGAALVAASDNLGDGGGTSETYDPATNAWSDPVAMADLRCSPAATTMADGRPMVIGGDSCVGTGKIATAEYFATPAAALRLRIPTTGKVTQTFLSVCSHLCTREKWFTGYWDEADALQIASKGGSHSGVDISSGTTCSPARDTTPAIGTPVYAAADGDVIWAGFTAAFGWTVVIRHGVDVITGHFLFTLYAHMGTEGSKSVSDQKHGSASCVNVSVGDHVTGVGSGNPTIIGYQGSSGNVTGPHLHFTIFAGNSDLAGAITTPYLNRLAAETLPASPDLYLCLALTAGDQTPISDVVAGDTGCSP